MTTSAGGTAPRQQAPLITLLIFMALLFLCGFGGQQVLKRVFDTDAHAHDRAVDSLRKEATESRDDITGLLRDSPPGEDPNALLTRVKELVEHTTHHGTVFGTPTATGGRLRLDVAFEAMGEAGGGLDAKSVTLRACVRMEGKAGRNAAVSMRDVPCDPNLPDHVPQLGAVQGVAKVAD
jgi:hypothetical protein